MDVLRAYRKLEIIFPLLLTRAPRCVLSIARGQRGHCQPATTGDGKGWCFLEALDDPSRPQDDCFEDVQWSPSNGRFWSSRACEEEFKDRSVTFAGDILYGGPVGRG